MAVLSVNDHSRDSAGLTYVYPVISRRSGGLSIGINLNTNNACNWRCIYCQVPGLQRGAGADIDSGKLERELRHLLDDILQGDFCVRHDLTQEGQVIRDIAISGNGEPTTCPQFDGVINVLGEVCARYPCLKHINRVLITNGSQFHKHPVQRGVADWSTLGGEVWFKIDSTTQEGLKLINSASLSPETVRRNIETCAQLCPTWIQTCLFGLDGYPPSTYEQATYLSFLESLVKTETPILGVLLDGLARPSCQPEATRRTSLPAEWLVDFGGKIEALGVPVKIYP